MATRKMPTGMKFLLDRAIAGAGGPLSLKAVLVRSQDHANGSTDFYQFLAALTSRSAEFVLANPIGLIAGPLTYLKVDKGDFVGAQPPANPLTYNSMYVFHDTGNAATSPVLTGHDVSVTDVGSGVTWGITFNPNGPLRL